MDGWITNITKVCFESVEHAIDLVLVVGHVCEANETHKAARKEIEDGRPLDLRS